MKIERLDAILCLRILMGLIFIYASYDKILNPAAFAEIIYNYQVLPGFLINISALLLPWFELFLGLCLIFGIWLPGAAFCVSALMTVFISLLAFNMWRGLDIQCGCFSTTPSEPASALYYVTRDGLFFAASVALFVLVVRRNLSRFRGAEESIS